MSAPSNYSFATFGAFLKHLRQRAGLTQDEFGLAVGYSRAHVARLENNQRTPDAGIIRARFIDALDIAPDSEDARTLLELAVAARSVAGIGGLSAIDDETAHLPSQKPRHNLPPQLTRFIGRATEVEQVERLLLERRAVTLIGSGGVGKTRLALEVGRRSLEAYADGVWLVDLAPLLNPALVARAICATFDLPERPERTDLEMALNFLAPKRMLLVLDNCEHLIEACAQMVERVTQSCPRVSILATSREPLQIAGESAWRVHSLTSPDPSAALPMQQLLAFEAPQLFIERMRDVQTSSHLTAGQAAAIAEVCHRLDGIPLALEMAAAQTDAMTVEELAARLENRFNFLTHGARSALPRHRTLRAVQEWSYDLLAPAEQRLLARLSVFVGGWTAEAAEAMHGEANTLGLLVQLVHKSMVVAEPRDGRMRYRLLETVRQFALEKLEGYSEVEEMRRRHCDYFTTLAESFEPSMVGLRLKAWCDQIGADWGNIRAAVNWARAQPEGGVPLARIAGPLWHYWIKRGSGQEILVWLQEAVARTTEGDGMPRARALVAFAGCQMTWYFSDRPAERAMVAESLRISRRMNDPACEAYSLMLSGGFQDMHTGTPESHLEPIQQALRIFRQAGHLLGIGDALRNLALMHNSLGDAANAVKVLEASAIWCYETGETMTLFNSLNYLAAYNAPRAIELGEMVLAKQREIGDEEGIAAALQVLGRIHFKSGHYAMAQPILEECHARWSSMGRLWSESGGTARCQWDLGPVLAFLGEGERGAEMLAQSRAEYDQAGDDHGVVWAIYFRGQVLLMIEDVAGAEQEMREVARRFLAQGDLFGAALALCKMGEIALMRRDFPRALHLIGAVLRREPNLHLHDMPPPWREAHERTLAHGRAHSDDPAFVAGRRMTIDEAVAYAL